MKHGTLSKVNGRADFSREVLERNLMDYLTGEMDFDDALELVENATYEELKIMVVKYLAD